MSANHRLSVVGLSCGLSLSTFLASILTSILLAATLLVALPQSVWAQTTYDVCPSGCDFASPEAAVNDAGIVDGDTIDIVTGTYVLSTTLLVDNSITILANNSVFDANGIRAIDVLGGANLSLTNVTIHNGRANAAFGGGALRVSGGSVATVINGTFENNAAAFGGAVHNNGSTVTLRESVFSGNRAEVGDGGAVFTDSGGITNVTRTEIDGNQASVAGGGLAVADTNSQLNFIASTISNNIALTPAQTISNLVISGSTIFCGGGPAGQTFIADASALSAFEFDIRLNSPADLTVIPNDINIPGQVRQGGPGGPIIATASAFAPGGVWLGESTQTLTFNLDQPVVLVPGETYAIESVISGAYSIFISSLSVDEYAGGGLYNCTGSFVPNWDFVFRTFGGTPGDGGGIHASAGGSAGLFNSTVSGNVGAGAVAAPDGTVTSLFSTVTNNSGNGLAAQAGAPAGLVFITASILAGNAGNDCDGNTITSSGYNLVGDDTGCIFSPFTGDLIGTGPAPIDPLLGPLQNNGGWTATHALDAASPAVNGAGASLGPPCSDAADDQRGLGRPVGPACDIGSFEWRSPLQPLIDAAAPGAIVDIPDGSYTGLVTIGDGVTLRGSGPDNAVIDASGLGGSAISATGDFALENIRVTGGDSADNGGGIVAITAGTNIVLNNVVLDNNNAVQDGGAIYLLNGTLSLTNVTFSDNNAGGNGGALFSGLDTTAAISHSLFESNTANSSGGAIGGAGTMDIRSSTLSGNTATVGNGGGIGLTGGTARLHNVTLAFNTASSGLGGAFYADPGAFITITNSLLSDNAGGPTNCDGLVSLGYNLFQTDPCPPAGTDLTDIIAEPLINGLAANGGPTETHSLQSLSPAINAGHPVPKFLQFDGGNLPLLQIQGYTQLDGGALLLAAGAGQVGSAFVANPIDPTRDFSAKFEFLITQNPDPDPGDASDGFTFTISDDPTVLGQAGGFLGIGIPDPIEPFPAVRGVVNGVSVEFDTWVNGQAEGANDPGSVDHIGIDLNGSLSSEVLTVLGPHGTLSDGNVWTAWVDYDATTRVLEVRASNDGIRPAPPTVSSAVDISSLTGPSAYVGFTGATGSAGIDGEHRILSFSFSSSCEASDQRGDPRPKGAACDIGAFEAAAIPPVLGTVSLSTQTTSDEEDDSISYPGVVDIPIIDIPIEKLTGDSSDTPESAPLGSFPLGSFPLGSFVLQTSPLGSFPLGSFPLGSFPLGSFPLGSFPLSSIPLLSAGGWTEILDAIPELAGAPLQTVTLEQLLRLSPLPDSVASIALRDLAIEGSPLASLSLPGLSLGATSVAELDAWALNADSSEAEAVCATLLAADSSFTDCTDEDTLLGLEIKGAPVSALSLGSLPLGSFQVGSAPIGSFPLGSFPIGSFPLGSFPLGSFPLGSFPLGSFPLGSFPLGSFPLGSFPLGSFNLLAAPLGSFPLGSFPLGSFPLGSFEIDGKSFCQFYDEQALADGSSSCADLAINPDTDSLADLVEALQVEADSAGDTTSGIASTPLGSFPLGSFDISNLPLGSFSLDALSEPPISLLTLGGVDVEGFDGCTLIADNSTDTCSSLGLDDGSTLSDLAGKYGGSLAASPLGSFPLGSFGVADLPMGSFPLGSFEINGTPLGSFPLGSFDLVGSPLGSFPLGSFSSLAAIIDSTVSCTDCRTLADAELAGAILASATLTDLRLSSEFATTTLGEVLNAMTLAMLYGPGTLADIENTGNLTLGQLLIAMMLKSDFPWETIPIGQLDAQEFSADNFVAYLLDFELTGSETETVAVEVTLADSFLYVKDSAELVVETPLDVIPSAMEEPAIIHNGDGTQTLSFNMILGGFGVTNNTIRFTTVPAMALGDYSASATVQLGTGASVEADASNAAISIIPDPRTDISGSDSIPTSPVDVLLLGFINTPDDNDFYRAAPVAKGDRVAVFMSNPAGDNDLIMYEPLSTVEAKGQVAEAPALDSIPFEDDGVIYEGNTTEEPNALEDVNLAAAPLASISTNRGDADESVSAISGDDAPFTIQVSGYNGAISEQPYSLRVKVTPRVPNPQCSARGWPGDANSTVLPAGSWMPDTNAVFLVNGARLAASEGNGSTAVDAADAALTAINNLIHAPGITNGVVIDVATIFGVDYGPWDANPCDVDAANAIVNAITLYLEEQRVGSPNLTYVTIVGSDEIIPFARKPDETSIANESTFANEFSDNAMFGALVTRHFLSDDTYGDIDPIPWLDRYLNVPELGVGRLVESATDIQLAAENYIAFAGVLDPQTALSAGYDFVADAAQKIDETFNIYSPALGFDVEQALIDQPGVPQLDAWTRSDFLSATGLNSPQPVDQVSFNMHFDFDEALPSSGDAAGNYTENLINTTDLGSTDLTGGIWFTVGCHSGSNLADVSVVGSAPGDDWAQAFSRLGAVYLAQNAYGLGDTEAIALTERLMANFARNLNGSLSIGRAHAFAKQQYFANLGLYGEYDYKALQAATLFGLPMYQYGNGAMIVEPPPPVLPVVTDLLSGLASATWSVSSTGITQTSTESKGELFSVDGEVQFVHFRPLQPIVRRDVTGPDGEIASGAFLTSLVTEDIAVADIAFARPVIALGEIEPEIESDEVVFPTAFTNIANFKAPPLTGGPFVPRQQLNVIVGQFTSPLDGASSGTERLLRSFDAKVFYRPASPAVEDDFIRPEFDNVQASVVGSSGAQHAAFSVDVSDEGTVERVAVLYLQSVSNGQGNWVLADLVRGDGSNTWTGGGPVDLTGITDGQIDYMAQAVDSNGNVANSTFKGLFYVAEELPPAPAPGGGPGNIGVVVTVGGEEVEPGDWISTDPVEVGITNQNTNTIYVYSVDFAPFIPLTSAGFQITGDGVHIVTVQESDGSNPVTFVILIDTTQPQAVITTPAPGEFIVQTQEPAADFACLDAGSGIATCVGTVPDGAPVPSATTGSHTFVVTARDNAQLDPVMAEHDYFVIQHLEVNGPTGPTAINEPVAITASATDLPDFVETAIIDWGDGSALETIDLGGTSVSDMSGIHSYSTPDVYQVTVTVDYEGQFLQVGKLDSVVIYDSKGGFVTGGGWFDSPPGAYTPNDQSDPFVTGKAHFGFNAKYTKGKSVPEGSTNFRLAAGDLEFKATSHDWMVISGARVRYKGEGTVKGSAGLYKFQVTALDADISGAGITRDGFRIKIWQEDAGGAEVVLYDNGLGVDDSTGNGGATPLGGGSVTIHGNKKRK